MTELEYQAVGISDDVEFLAATQDNG